jgi:tetratricopeptide (TPR) repeat protein
MKKIILLFSLILEIFVLQAQSLEQGTQQMYYERYQSAENTFHQVLQNDANNISAWYYLAKVYVLEDKPDKANDSLQSVPVAIKADPWYKVACGNILLHQGKKDEAINYFNEALKDTKEKDAGILSEVADAHIQSKYGDGNYAIDLLNKAIKRDKKNAGLYVLLGDAYMKLSNGSEAFKSYQNAIEINDKYAPAYHKLGELFVTQKNPETYVGYFQKAIAADPNYAPSLYRLYVYEFNRNPAIAMDY